MKRFLLFFTLCSCSYIAQAQVPRCQLISMETLGGDRSEGVSSVIRHYPDGSFGFTLSTNSNTGDINLGCFNGYGGRLPVYVFDPDNYTSIHQPKRIECAPKSAQFIYPSDVVFTQSNGDRVYFGADANIGSNIGIERSDAAGNVLWSKLYGGSFTESFAGAVQSPDGSFYVLANTTSSDGDVPFHYGDPSGGVASFNPDIWLLHLDNDGNLLWSRVLGTSEVDLAGSLQVAADGSCYVFGSLSFDDFDGSSSRGGGDVLIAKFDSSGQKIWQRCYGGTRDEGYYPKSQSDGYGGFYVLARTSSVDGDIQRRPVGVGDVGDYWLFHINGDGQILWENTFGDKGVQTPFNMCIAADGSIWMAGQNIGTSVGSGEVDAFYGQGDGWVAHCDSLGNFINQITIGSPEDEFIKTICPLSDGSVLVAAYYVIGSIPGGRSLHFPRTTQGKSDVFFARLGPNTVGLDKMSKETIDWSIYPNPAKGMLHIVIKGKNITSSLNYEIKDSYGRSIQSRSLNQSRDVDISTWAAGIYYMTLLDAKGYVETKKFTIVNK